MANDIIKMMVPAVGESINEVTISSWLKKEGDVVELDEIIAEIDSDKATFDLTAESSGKLIIEAKEGDEVILPSISFVGVANAIMYKKAKPVFCDVDKHTLNPTVKHIEEKITSKTKAVINKHRARAKGKI